MLQVDGSYAEIAVYPGAAPAKVAAPAVIQRVEQVLVDKMHHDDNSKHVIAQTEHTRKMSEYYGAPAQKVEAPAADVHV